MIKVADPMLPMRARLTIVLLPVLFTLNACTPVRLDVTLPYRTVPPAERIEVPCYYSIDPSTQAAVLSHFASGLRAEIGPGISEQLRVALQGLCRNAHQVKTREEFRGRSANTPAVLFEVHADGEMEPAVRAGARSTGSIAGTAVVIGSVDRGSLQYAFSGKGSKSQVWGETTGGEGLRAALHEAVQRLVDDVRLDRARIHELAGLSQ